MALALLAGGLFAGFLTGLIGIGGGVVMVPLMYQLFLHQGVLSKPAFTTAVATSLAVMIFSGAVAAYSYYKKGQLKPQLMLWTGIGTLLGASLGSRLMIASDDHPVRIAFGVFLWLVAASLYLPRAALQPHDHVPSWRYNAGLLAVGLVMGAISALFGVGGGALLVPALVVLFGVAIHSAVATSTAIIVLTALFGSVNYMVLGWNDPLTPAHGIGWIDPLAWALLLPGALFATRAGIRTAMGLSREHLRNVLVLFQIAIGARFVFF